MLSALGRGAGSDVAAAVAATVAFAQPIVTAYEMEGSRHYNAPQQIGGSGAADCVQGTNQ